MSSPGTSTRKPEVSSAALGSSTGSENQRQDERGCIKDSSGRNTSNRIRNVVVPSGIPAPRHLRLQEVGNGGERAASIVSKRVHQPPRCSSLPVFAKATLESKGNCPLIAQEVNSSLVSGHLLRCGPSKRLQRLVFGTMKEETGTVNTATKHEPSVAKVPPMLQAKKSDINGEVEESNEDQSCNGYMDNVNTVSGENGEEKAENERSNVESEVAEIKRLSVKPMGPLRIQDTPDYGLYELYPPTRRDCIGEKRHSCSGRKGCRGKVSCRSRDHGHRSPSRCHRSPRKCHRRIDCGFSGKNCCPLDDSLDDTSSLSSESATTTTTTSSSMSSSTYGDLSGISLPSHHLQSSHTKSSSRSSSASASSQRPDLLHHTQEASERIGQLPPTPTHGPKRSSPRKTVKKTDTSIQTDSSSLKSGHSGALSSSTLSTWKKYFLDQQMNIKSSCLVGESEHIRLKGINQASRVQPSDSHSINGDPLMIKFSSHNNSMGEDFAPSSCPSSGGQNGGKAVAIIKATSATTGRIPNSSKSQVSRLKASKTSSSSPYSYGDTIYSDSEYMHHTSSSSAYYTKYSYLTSPIRLRSGVSTVPTRSSVGGDSTGYGQVDSPWFKRNGFGHQRNALTEAESMESLSGINGNSIRRPNSAAHKTGSSMHEPPGTPTRCPIPPSTPSRLKLRSGPTNGNILASPNISKESSRKQMVDKEADLFSSALSLASNSTVFTQVEDKHSLEIRKLKRDLEQANEKVVTLTSQLSTNAHMVNAFEQSLATMTARLQQLTTISEKKDSELNRLRKMMEEISRNRKKESQDSVEPSLPKKSSKKEKEKKSLLIRRHTFASASNELRPHLPRDQSKDSISSCSDHECRNGDAKSYRKDRKCSADSVDSHGIAPAHSSKGWLRNSLTKAFRKSRSSSKYRGSPSEAQILVAGHCGREGDSCSVPNSPMLSVRNFRTFHSSRAGSVDEDIVDELKHELMEKERALTELRLESLAAAHQLDNFKEMISKMQSEMQALKKDNDRLQRIMVSNSIGSSKSSELSGCQGSISPGEGGPKVGKLIENDENTIEGGKRVHVVLDSKGIGTLTVAPETTWSILDGLVSKAVESYLERIDPDQGLGLNSDSVAFYEVGAEKQVRSFRGSNATPELLPFGYIVHEPMITIHFKSFLEKFAFDCLIPKSIIQRFVTLLNEHKRLILYGPSGTGKTFLAHKIAEFLVIKAQKGARLSRLSFESEDVNSISDFQCPTGSIATFNLDSKSADELKSYLTTLEEQMESSSPQDLPTVVILDNLHRIESFHEVIKGNFTMPGKKFPFIVATMCQTACSASHNLNHNFRWLLCTNHMEPVKGLISRYLNRKLVQLELEQGSLNVSTLSPETSLVQWMPQVWQHINHFLEAYCSTEVTLGPAIFIECPVEMEASKRWFTDLWNRSIRPYLIEAAQESLKEQGLKRPFEDPTEWILRTNPWRSGASEELNVPRIGLQDIQPFSGPKVENLRFDPLSDMLLRLQVASSNGEESSSPNMIR